MRLSAVSAKALSWIIASYLAPVLAFLCNDLFFYADFAPWRYLFGVIPHRRFRDFTIPYGITAARQLGVVQLSDTAAPVLWIIHTAAAVITYVMCSCGWCYWDMG